MPATVKRDARGAYLEPVELTWVDAKLLLGLLHGKLHGPISDEQPLADKLQAVCKAVELRERTDVSTRDAMELAIYRAGYTTETFAAAVGVTSATIERWKTTHVPPSHAARVIALLLSRCENR